MSGAIQQLPVNEPLTNQKGEAIRTMRTNPPYYFCTILFQF